MPESVSGVDAIADGLRKRATGWSCVPLADAVAAVHAAADARTQEINRLVNELAGRPLLVETVGEAVVFVLDDGERLEFDRVELLSALGAEVAGGTPDSRRYAACGDGVVSNVAEWIGRGILLEDAA